MHVGAFADLGRAVAAGVPASLRGALGDGTDEQVTEHLIWLRLIAKLHGNYGSTISGMTERSPGLSGPVKPGAMAQAGGR